MKYFIVLVMMASVFGMGWYSAEGSLIMVIFYIGVFCAAGYALGGNKD